MHNTAQHIETAFLKAAHAVKHISIKLAAPGVSQGLQMSEHPIINDP
jgi:hypothetical protein